MFTCGRERHRPIFRLSRELAVRFRLARTYLSNRGTTASQSRPCLVSARRSLVVLGSSRFLRWQVNRRVCGLSDANPAHVGRLVLLRGLRALRSSLSRITIFGGSPLVERRQRGQHPEPTDHICLIDALFFEKGETVPRKYSRLALRGMLAVFMSNAVLFCGCGGSSGDGAAATTEEARRYSALKQMGTGHSKEEIAAHKKQALRRSLSRKKRRRANKRLPLAFDNRGISYRPILIVQEKLPWIHLHDVGLYIDRAIGRHRDHRGLDCPVAARGPVCARGGPQNSVHKQPQTDWPGAAQLSFREQHLPPGPLLYGSGRRQLAKLWRLGWVQPTGTHSGLHGANTDLQHHEL